MTTPTSALVEEAQSMTTDTLIEEAMGEMHRLGIDNLRAKGAIVLLVEALRRAEAELDAATTQLAKKFKRLEELEKRAEKAEAERDAAIARAVNAEQEQADMERLLEMQHERTRQADELWRKQHNKPLTSPDLGTLIEWLMKRAEKAEAERDAQRAEGLRLAGERDALVFHNAEIKEAMLRAADQRDELTATRDLLTKENARLQKERDDALARGARDDAGVTVHACPAPGSGLMPCCGRPPLEVMQDRITRRPELVNCDRVKVMRELAEARAHIATLELLRRGGK